MFLKIQQHTAYIIPCFLVSFSIHQLPDSVPCADALSFVEDCGCACGVSARTETTHLPRAASLLCVLPHSRSYSSGIPYMHTDAQVALSPCSVHQSLGSRRCTCFGPVQPPQDLLHADHHTCHPTYSRLSLSSFPFILTSSRSSCSYYNSPYPTYTLSTRV